jgi:hypothetical protein
MMTKSDDGGPKQIEELLARRSRVIVLLNAISLDFSNISVHRGRESEKDVVLQQFL